MNKKLIRFNIQHIETTRGNFRGPNQIGVAISLFVFLKVLTKCKTFVIFQLNQSFFPDQILPPLLTISPDNKKLTILLIIRLSIQRSPKRVNFFKRKT